MRTTATITLLALVLTLNLMSGCSSMTRMATGAVADALAKSGDSFTTDDDIELVGAAIPFALKTIESLLTELPEHRGLLLAATKGFTQYAYVYVEHPADELEDTDIQAAYAQRARARRMYQRARDYGVRGLSLGRQDFAATLLVNPRDALTDLTVADVPLVYWTAMSWGAAISLGKDDPNLLADLPVVHALISRALELDEAHDQGAIHTFMISFETGRPDVAMDDAVTKARNHFDRAIVLSRGLQASPYVALAEAVTVPMQDRHEFEALLGRALAVDPGEVPNQRLVNLVMQRRARWLLKRTEDYFLE